MADNSNQAGGPCIGACLKHGPSEFTDSWNGWVRPLVAGTYNFVNHRSRETAIPIVADSQRGNEINDGCEDQVASGRMWESGRSGGGTFSYANGRINGQGSSGTQEVTVEFDCPMDLMLAPSSFQAGGGRFFWDSGADWVLLGGSGNLQGLPSGTVNGSQDDLPQNSGGSYRDNQGPSYFLYLARRQIKWRHTSEGGNLTSRVDMRIGRLQMGPLELLDRCVAYPEGETCVDGQTPRWRMGCAQTFPDPSAATIGFQEGPQTGGATEYSNDFGVTWNPSTGPVPITVGDANGMHRWRQPYTIPAGYSGHLIYQHRSPYANKYRGIFQHDGAAAADFVFGGGPVGQTVGPGFHSGYIPVVPGDHVMEFQNTQVLTTENFVPTVNLMTRAVTAAQAEVQIIECLDAAGAVVSTSYLNPDGTPYVVPANTVVREGLCNGCCNGCT